MRVDSEEKFRREGVRLDEGQSSNSHHRHRLGYRLFLLFLDHPFHPFGLGF